MLLRIFKVIWFFSLLATSAVLLYVYASLPSTVSLMEGAGGASIQREYFFYIALGLLATFNLLVFVMRRLHSVEEEWNVVAWFYGLVVCFNLFLVVSMSFASLINSGEKFDYPRIGFIIYSSLILLAAWSASWPLYRVVRRIRS
jgi:hypothetical protein